MIFNFEREDELPEEKKAEKFFENEIVYDIKGNTYIFEETTKNGYLCTEIYQEQPSYYEPPEDVIGDTVLLKEIFSEPPVKKKAEEVVELEKKISELRNELKDLQEEKRKLDRLTEKTPEEIVQEKLKDLPNVNKFLEFLTKQETPYRITDTGTVVSTGRNLYFGINGSGNIRVFDPNGYECYEYMSDKAKYFSTREEAEKVAFPKIKACYKSQSYEWFINVEPLFDKYDEQLPNDWHAIKEQKKVSWIDEKRVQIERKKEEIRRAEKSIAALDADIEAIENNDFDHFRPFV